MPGRSSGRTRLGAVVLIVAFVVLRLCLNADGTPAERPGRLAFAVLAIAVAVILWTAGAGTERTRRPLHALRVRGIRRAVEREQSDRLFLN